MKAQHLKRSPLAKGERVQPHVGAYVAFLRSPELSVGAKLLLLALKTYYNRTTLLCCPSYDALRADLGCTRNSISKWLSELESQGVICRYTPPGERKRLYHLLDDDYAKRLAKLARNTTKERQISSTHLRTRISTHLRTLTNSSNHCAPLRTRRKIVPMPKAREA